MGSKRFGSENFLSKKTGRVKPRGRIYDSTPQKIVGLKFCWVVFSCPKRFFAKKKNSGRVKVRLWLSCGSVGVLIIGRVVRKKIEVGKIFFFWSKIFRVKRFILVKKNFLVENIFLAKKNFWVKKFFG